MYARCREIADSSLFEQLILLLILINAAVMGFETSVTLNEEYGEIFFLILFWSQFVFSIEIIIRMMGYGPRFGGYFKDFWNLFDFTVVALSLLPAVGPFVMIARLVRLLRVLRIMTVSDRLREFLQSFRHSLDEALYLSIIFGLFLYIFAIAGFYLFSEVDSDNWGSLGLALRTLIYILLLQRVPEIFESLSDHLVSSILFLFFYAGTMLLLLLNAIGAFVAEHTVHKRGDTRD